MTIGMAKRMQKEAGEIFGLYGQVFYDDVFGERRVFTVFCSGMSA